MSIAYTVDRDRAVIFEHWSGSVSARDLGTYWKRILSDPEVTTSQARVPDSLQYLNAITPGARDIDPR
jgi:hypothetical protein